jgi:hypothetical protein
VGERQNRPSQLSFNSSLKVDFQGARVTSDGGLILVRASRLERAHERHLMVRAVARTCSYHSSDLLRQSVYSRLAGYADVNDAERPSQDPTFRLIGSRRSGSVAPR